MVASLPLFSLVFLFGGVSPDQVALAFVISLVSALTLGAIGVFLSVLIRRGPTATVIAYAVTFILLIGTPLLTIFLSLATNSSIDDSAFLVLPLALNPLAALASATVASFFDGVPLLGPPAGPPSSGTGDWLSLWHISLVVDAVLFLVFLSLAAMMLRPGVSWSARLRLVRLTRGRG
jgi:ABC-type transport system involved in multi-copper enzyme maturation permease subunit